MTLDDSCLSSLKLYGGEYSGLEFYPSNSKTLHRKKRSSLRGEDSDANSPSTNQFRSLPEDHGTSHISVIDKWGNAVAMTTTVNTYFGSKFISPSTGLHF
jgi:gamma-glutamyltranspeptidase/glutathione hydrolase/leukotriene-C4 hydrolase